MFDHVGLKVKDLAKSRKFYESALAPVGYKVIMEFPGVVGMGVDRPIFWIGAGKAQPANADPGVHVAFVVGKRSAVDAFHAAAIKAGGKDNGKPGIRAKYHPDYYGAFVHDPDGNNIEAVCHDPKG